MIFVVESPSDFLGHLSALDPKRKKGPKSGKMLNEETNVETVFRFKAHIFFKNRNYFPAQNKRKHE